MINSNEKWSYIKKYDGYYIINIFGVIKSTDRGIPDKRLGVRQIKGKILKQRIDLNGYQVCQLWKHNKCKNPMVHRLLAETFIPNPENKRDVNHINGKRSDNRLENLEWATRSENVKHGYDVNGRKSAVSKKVVSLKSNKIYNSLTDASKDTGVPIKSISTSCIGTTKVSKYERFSFINI